LPWTAKIHDMDPLENAWGYFVRDVYQCFRHFRDKKELKAAVTQSWEKMDKKFVRSCTRSMPKRGADLF